jgi:hypothetical protein
MFCYASIAAQNSDPKCRPAVIPIENEPPPKIHIEAPLTAPLARGVAVIQYCTENLHIVPVFGAQALQVTPRVGHLHVRVDDASWVWAEAGGNPIILMGLAPGPHKVTLELVNANHQPLDKAEVAFTIPKKSVADVPQEKEQPVTGSGKGKKAVRETPAGVRQASMAHHPYR